MRSRLTPKGGLVAGPYRGVNNFKNFSEGRFERIWHPVRHVPRKMPQVLRVTCAWAFQVGVSPNWGPAVWGGVIQEGEEL